MKIGKSIVLVGVCACGLLATGCQSVNKGIAGVTGEEAGTTGFERVTWDADVGEINPPSPERRTVYAQFNDASGQGVEMREDLREELKRLGYEVVSNPDTAAYKLQVRIISLDRREAGDRVDGTGQVLTSTTGRLGDRAAQQIGGGGLVGDLLGGVSDIFREGVVNRTTAKEWCLVANFTLAELVPEGVTTTNHSSTYNRTGSGSYAGNASGATGGSRSTGDGQSQAITQLKNHFEIRRTLTASTTKWDLDRDEALNRLLPRLLKAAANALPAAV